ncbi:MAG TPA: hypothetical protein VKE69_01040 [Planctomycetota bacterium]|nr:hypothetical protein [Planctomycetota bacterium]
MNWHVQHSTRSAPGEVTHLLRHSLDGATVRVVDSLARDDEGYARRLREYVYVERPTLVVSDPERRQIDEALRAAGAPAAGGAR